MSDSNDIVTELRNRHANVTGIDPRITTPIVGQTIFSQAADEIERLRAARTHQEYGIAYPEQHIQELVQTINTLRAERDEARRSCCEYAAIVDGADTTEGMESGRFYERAMKYMKDRGWDCYKENTDE